MPNEIDDLIAQATAQPEKAKKKREYQPLPGEEAIFERQPGMLERISESGIPGAIAAGLVPFSRQLQGKMPWEWSPETVMEGLSWLSGGLIRGRGMPKETVAKGAAGLRTALEDIGSELLGKRGVPAIIPEGPLPAAIERGFQRKPSGEVAAKYGRAKKEPAQLTGAIERKLLPRAEGYPGQRASYAGPTAPGGIQLPYAPQTWRERTFPGTIKRAQDIIEDLFRESLRAKGLID